MAKKTTKRKGRSKGPNHVLTLRVLTSAHDDAVLIKSCEAHRQVYNGVLGEMLKRLKQCRQDGRYLKACRTKNPDDKKEAFAFLRQTYGLDKSLMEKLAKEMRDSSWIAFHVRSADTQRTAERAYDAVMQYMFGNRGRPRFKGKRGLHSIEGKSNEAVLRFRDHQVHYLGLTLSVTYDGRKKEREYQQHFQESDIKYCRLLWRNVKGQRQWYVQLILPGNAPIKEKYRDAFAKAQGKKASLDFGPSEVAIVSDDHAAVLPLAEGVEYPWKELRKLRRRMDRSRRAMNPKNYNTNGTIKKGKKAWTNSRRYEADRQAVAELERVLAGRRRTSHGRLANLTRCMGSEARQEAVSAKGWQKMFGRSSKIRASGLAQRLVASKAESAGGYAMLINTRTTRLSQYCHVRDDYVKKPLSQRYHEFPDGTRTHRDLYSAFLAQHVQEVNVADPNTGKIRKQYHLGTCQTMTSAWPAVDSRLKRTVPRSYDQLASVLLRQDHESSGSRQSESSANPENSAVRTRPTSHATSRRSESAEIIRESLPF